jgi:hypothetical protein
MSKQEVKNSFDETGKDVSPIRKAMILYSKGSREPKVKKYYRMKYFDGDSYYGIKYESLVIEANSRLDAIIVLKDHFNRYAKSVNPCDFYDDDLCFIDIVCEYPDINCYDVDDIFSSNQIKEIMNKYVESQFNNESLWLEECDYPNHLKSDF